MKAHEKRRRLDEIYDALNEEMRTIEDSKFTASNEDVRAVLFDVTQNIEDIGYLIDKLIEDLK